jgi:lysyl-tRNA synthetase class 2
MLRDRLERKARFISETRRFFAERGFVEVDTPILSPALIPEPSIEVFRTELIQGSSGSRPLFLIPSPELWMKRLIARGSGNIFQIAPSFRNGDHGSPVHNPEFRLLEWYEMGASYLDCIPTIEALVDRLLRERQGGENAYEVFSPPFLRMSVEEAFIAYAGIELRGCRDARDIVREGERLGLTMPRDPTWEEAYHVIFLSVVEPSLPRGKPLILMDYPAEIPTTARRAGEAPFYERWELYIDGVEIANCYSEETDPVEIRSFLQKEERRKDGCVTPHPTDNGFAAIFDTGFPACAGVALGLDRLEMVLHGQKSLEGVILFPFSAIV